ncbi:hypothetical protein GCM10023114_22280 [Mycolicibacterium sediminis]|uniref:Amino acid permease n=2 Tax=Mycolicibacterium sediminis TaxID=1286180 RepID=A0A7I7QKN0_9MYCO|nr:hypothetical protein MSEDJ_06230 [Mycolicibacterium sediminis]
MSAGAGGNGLGTLAGAIVFGTVIYALVRLRRRAPHGATTGDLVASTLGRGAGETVTILQLAAYTAFAALSATAFGLAVLFAYVDDPLGIDTWLWPLYGLAALTVAAVVAYALPARATAAIAAVLAGVGALGLFYVALAVTAKALTDPDLLINPLPDAGPWTALAVIGALAFAAKGVIGVELITTQSDRVASVGRPMATGIIVAAVVAVTCWYAVRAADPGVARIDGRWATAIAQDLFGDAARYAYAGIAVSLSLAGLLAMMLGIVRLTGTMEAHRVPEVQLVSAVVVAALLVVGMTRAWLHADEIVPWVAMWLLLLVYAVIIEANARLDDGPAGWWLRVVMPAVFLAMILLPIGTARSIVPFLPPLAVTLVIAVLASGVGAAKARHATG